MTRLTEITLSLACLTCTSGALASITETAKLVPAGTIPDDSTGWSTAASGDWIALGSPYDNPSGVGGNAGSVVLYTNQASGDFQESQLLTASNGGGWEHFGMSVRMAGDLLITGAPQHPLETREGAAYIFRLGGDGVWTEEAILQADNGLWGDFFGHAVDIDGDTAIVGAYRADSNGNTSGAAYVFNRASDGTWSQGQQLTPTEQTIRFGTSVAIEGDTIIVGSPRDNIDGTASGSAYIFTRNTDLSWSETTRITPDDLSAFDFFGYAVALGPDGKTAMSSSLFGDQAGPNAGTVYSFTLLSNDVWTQDQALIPFGEGEYEKFGSSIDLSGEYAIIGCHGYTGSTGHGFLYVDTENDGWIQTARLEASDGDTGAEIGFAAAIDGNHLVLGAPRQDDTAGAAYLYELDRSLQYGDTNKDGSIDILDLILVIAQWGDCPNAPAPCDGDINRTGRVDIEDLLAVLNAFH